MADAFDQFPDAPQSPQADAWAEFPDADQAPANVAPDGRTRAQLEQELAANQAESERLGADLTGKQNLAELARAGFMPFAKLTKGAMSLPALALDAATPGRKFGEAQDAMFGARSYFAPRNGEERFVGNVTEGLGGAMTGGLVGGLANTGVRSAQAAAANINPSMLATNADSALRRVGTQLQNMQGALSATVGGVSGSEIAREAGGNPFVQTLAGMAGSMAPGVTSNLVQRGVQKTIGAPEDVVTRNVAQFKNSGTTPTLGQATERRTTRGIESALSKIPGSAGVVAKKAQTQGEQLGAGLESQANALAKKATPQKTGQIIDDAITGKGGFIEQGKAKQAELYNKLDSHFPAARPVEAKNTAAALKDLNKEISGAESLSRWFQNAKIRGIWASFLKDTGVKAAASDDPLQALNSAKSLDQLDVTAQKFGIGMSESPSPQQMALENAYFDIRAALSKGGSQSGVETSGRIPYEAVKKLRTLVGEEVGKSAYAGAKTDKWDKLYASLSKDIEAAVGGNASAKNAFKNANNFTREYHKRMKVVSSVLDKNGGTEAVYNAVVSGTKDGDTVLRATMQSIPKDAQKQLAATFLRHLGRARGGQQNASGDAFSTETFLTNWSNLSNEAKRTLFSRFTPDLQKYVKDIAGVSSNLRQGSKVFANPSGTAPAENLIKTAGTFATAGATGNVPGLLMAGAGMGGANLAARGMMNPSKRMLDYVSLRPEYKPPPAAFSSFLAQRPWEQR